MSEFASEVPLAGRRQALARLHRTFVRVQAGRILHLEVIYGEAGVGKTRLCSEFARSAHERSATVLFGRCTESAGSAYQPFLQALGHLRDVDDDVAHELTELLGQASSRSVYGGASDGPDADRYQLFERLAPTLERVAANHSLVLVLDDLHWATPAAILALTHLVRRPTRGPMMLLATVRAPEFGATDVIGPLGSEGNVASQHLRGLDVDEVRELLGHLDVNCSEVATLGLMARTDGNAFMVTELARGECTMDERSMPLVVRDVIASRARRLPDPALHLLQVASLIGLEFELDVLHASSETSELADVIQALDAAVAAQLIVERTTPQPSYEFSHALIRDALLATSTRARCSQHHERIGAALLAVRPEPTLATVSRLAYHFMSSGETRARALGCEFGEKATIASLAVFGYEDACAWYERVIAAHRDLPTDGERSVRRSLGLARSATLAGEQERARDAARAAWQMARAIGDGAGEVEAILLFAGEPEINLIGREVDGTQMLEASLKLGVGTSGEHARLLARLGSALSYMDHERSQDLAVRAVAAARAGGSPLDLAFAIRCRLRGWFDPDRIIERATIARELVRIGQSVGDGVTEAWGWQWVMAMALEQGELDEAEHAWHELDDEKTSSCPLRAVELSAYAGFRFPPEVIMLAVRWYLRFGLSYGDLEELLAERGVTVNHGTLFRWVQRFTPILINAADPYRYAVGDQWCVDETYVKVGGVWRCVYRAIDEHGQVIDVYVSKRRDTVAVRVFFSGAIRDHGQPCEVVTDQAAALAKAIGELAPDALHNTVQYANNRVEADHGRPKSARGGVR